MVRGTSGGGSDDPELTAEFSINKTTLDLGKATSKLTFQVKNGGSPNTITVTARK